MRSITQNELLDQLFGEDFAKKLQVGADQVLETAEVSSAAIADLKELGRAVLGSETGLRLLQHLVNITYTRPAYPPPAGQAAGEYAAMREGQRQIVATLINLAKDTA